MADAAMCVELRKRQCPPAGGCQQICVRTGKPLLHAAACTCGHGIELHSLHGQHGPDECDGSGCECRLYEPLGREMGGLTDA